MSDILDKLIDLAIQEDVGSGDITTAATVAPKQIGSGVIKVKQNLVLAGSKAAEKVFNHVDFSLTWKSSAKDGDELKRGAIIAKVTGSLASILTAERTALNFLQHLSGVATLAGKFAKVVCNTNTIILDTRKTIPGWRMLEKEAARLGGAVNHRLGLFDSYLIKDNHISSAGSITEAVSRVSKEKKPGVRVEVETKNISEIEEAIKAGADIVMLDNFSPEEVKDAVKFVAGKVKLEISGNITLENLSEYANAGADFISIGAITHSAPAADIHMLITPIDSMTQ